MFELLFLLLPVAAIYGYYMGKNSLNSKRQESKTQQSANYLKGFDYLLNNKQEKAVDKFLIHSTKGWKSIFYPLKKGKNPLDR